MSYGEDVYYNPQKHGLTTVAEIDYSSGSYEFDIRVVWRHEDGTLYTARDSGCSCPSPFEDYHKLDSLDKVNRDELLAEARNELVPSEEWRSTYVTQAEVNDFLRAVRDAS